MTEESYESKVERIAKAAHEINFSYCQAIDDPAQHWDEAPQTLKDSVKDGVRKHLADPNMKPEESHKSWLAFKAKDGWKYGPEKDFEKKTHPCFLPYSELPERQRAKDYIFKSVVEQLRDI